MKNVSLDNRPAVIGICFIGFLFLFGCLANSNNTDNYTPTTRTYYIAAENVEWDYAPSGLEMSPTPQDESEVAWLNQTTYQKVRYIEYTDETFSQKKEQPNWLGILGPIIRAAEGDTIKVVFYNKANQPYSIHPHGVLYDKDNEGAMNGQGAIINPGQKFTYTWIASKESAPSEKEGPSKVWLYHSHVDSVSEIYKGLVGPIIITSAKHANLDATPKSVDKEFVALFMVFNESTEETPEEEIEGHLKHTINGYIFGNLKGLEMDKGDKVMWHLIGLGTEVDLHTAHWHGETVLENERHTDVVELLPASMKTVQMTAKNVGEWMFHCHVADHITAGMMTTYSIN